MNLILLAGDVGYESPNIFVGFLQSFESFCLRTIGLLPDSFVNDYLTENNFDFLQYLNWFIPFYDFAVITGVWCTVMAALFAGRVALKLGDKISRLLK